MKKTVITILAIFLSSSAVEAQTWGEWFSQKKTQKEYLVKQIAALQTYISYARKGYKIADEGLKFIGDAKNGEFNFHEDYFSSLKQVNSAIAKDDRVTAIVTLQERMLDKSRYARGAFRQSGDLDREEKTHIEAVFTKLFEDCTRILEELKTVTQDGQLEMKDDERIRIIEQLYKEMQDNYSFCTLFINETKLLVRARLKEKNDLRNSRALSGINE